jgi:hypothetical protein
MAEKERRTFQRLKLAKPILAGLGGQNALILDIGLGGAFVEHYGEPKKGQRMILSFRWKNTDITFVTEVARSTVIRKDEASGQSVSQSALTFIEGRGHSEEKLGDMMATFIGHVLAAQRANAEAEGGVAGSAVLYSLGEARRERTRGFRAYLWDGEKWTCRSTQIGDQPRTGFTVAAYEDEEEVEELCRTYETADEEGRRLIRLVAELSVRSAK